MSCSGCNDKHHVACVGPLPEGARFVCSSCERKVAKERRSSQSKQSKHEPSRNEQEEELYCVCQKPDDGR